MITYSPMPFTDSINFVWDKKLKQIKNCSGFSLNFGIKKPVITLKGNDIGAGILLPPKENRCNISIFISSKDVSEKPTSP
jgi:hypothetical protein